MDNANFIGREVELSRLREALENGTRKIIVISGPGGIGKTFLTQHFLKLFPHNTLWLDCTIFSTHNPDTTTVHFNPTEVSELVQKVNPSCLILDEISYQDKGHLKLLEHLADLKEYHIFVLTRSINSNSKLSMKLVLHPFTLDEVVQFLPSELDKSSCAFELYKISEGNPLVLREMVKVIESKFNWDFHSYLETYQSIVASRERQKPHTLAPSESEICKLLDQFLAYFDPAYTTDTTFLLHVLQQFLDSDKLNPENLKSAIEGSEAFFRLTLIKGFEEVEIDKARQLEARCEIAATSMLDISDFLLKLVAACVSFNFNEGQSGNCVMHIVSVWNHFCNYKDVKDKESERVDKILTQVKDILTVWADKGDVQFEMKPPYRSHILLLQKKLHLADATKADSNPQNLQIQKTPGITMAPQLDEGQAIQIIDIEFNSKRQSSLIIKKTLKEILSLVGSRPVHIISITGASRQGKSFFITILVNMLSRIEQGLDNPWDDLLELESLKGFDFQNGIERKTVGFWMWSRPFILKKSDGSEVAVLIMDTQGVFDQHTTKRDWSMIVGLSMLISDSMIYNAQHNVLEDTLSIFHNFVEFGLLSFEESELGQKAFDKLIFLIRDWNMPESCSYGTAGGNKFLEQRLAVNQGMAEELKLVRNSLHLCFQSIDCCLLPHPGEKVKPNAYAGKLSILEDEFLWHVKGFVAQLLVPDEMNGKTINGQLVRGKYLLTYFEKYVQAFNAITLPKPKTLIETTIEARLSSIVDSQMEIVEGQFQEITESGEFVSTKQLKEAFQDMYDKSMTYFEETTKDIKLARSVKRNCHILSNELQKVYKNVDKINSGKKMEFQKDLVKRVVGSYAIIMRQEMDKIALLQEQFEDFSKAAKSQAMETINTCGDHDQDFFMELSEMLESELGVSKDVLQAENDSKLSRVEGDCKHLVLGLAHDYSNMLEMAKLGKGGHFTPHSLEQVHNKSFENVMEKFNMRLKVANALLYEKTEEELKQDINKILTKLLEETVIHANELDEKAEAMVTEVTNQLEVEINEFIAKEPRPSFKEVETQHLLKQGIFLNKLNSLYTIHPERAAEFIDLANNKMEKILSSCENKIQNHLMKEEVQLRETLIGVMDEFNKQLAEILVQPGISESQVKQECNRLQKEAQDANRHMSWTTDDNLRSAFKKTLSKQIKQELIEAKKKFKIRKDQEELEFKTFLDGLVDDFQSKMLAIIEENETLKDPELLERFHNLEMEAARVALELLVSNQPKKVREDTMLDLEGAFNQIYEQTKDKLTSKIQQLELEIQDRLICTYNTKMGYRCDGYDVDLPKLMQCHEQTLSDLNNEVLHLFGNQTKAENIATFQYNLYQKVQKSFEERARQLNDIQQQHKHQINEWIQNCIESFKAQAANESRVINDANQLRSCLEKAVKSLLEQFKMKAVKMPLELETESKSNLKFQLRDLVDAYVKEYQQCNIENRPTEAFVCIPLPPPPPPMPKDETEAKQARKEIILGDVEVAKAALLRIFEIDRHMEMQDINNQIGNVIIKTKPIERIRPKQQEGEADSMPQPQPPGVVPIEEEVPPKSNFNNDDIEPIVTVPVPQTILPLPPSAAGPSKAPVKGLPFTNEMLCGTFLRLKSVKDRKLSPAPKDLSLTGVMREAIGKKRDTVHAPTTSEDSDEEWVSKEEGVHN